MTTIIKIIFSIISFLTAVSIFNLAFAKDIERSNLNGKWVLSEQLKPGMKVITANNRVLTVRQSWQARSKSTTTYNFTVSNAHTYFVSEKKLWTHNTPKCDDPFDPRQLAANDGIKPKYLHYQDFYDSSGNNIGIYADGGEELLLRLNHDNPMYLFTKVDDLVSLGRKKFKNKTSVIMSFDDVKDMPVINKIQAILMQHESIKNVTLSITNNNAFVISIILK